MNRSLRTVPLWLIVTASAAGCIPPPPVDIAEAEVGAGVYSLSHRPPPGKVDRDIGRIEARLREPDGKTPGEGVELVLHIRQGNRPERVKAMELETVTGVQEIWSARIPRYGRGALVRYQLRLRLPDGRELRLPPPEAPDSTYHYLAMIPPPAGLVATRLAALGGALFLFLAACALAAYAGRARHETMRERALDWSALACALGTAAFFGGAFPLSWLREHLMVGQSGIDLPRGLADPTVRAVIVFLYWVVVASTLRGRLFENGARAGGEPSPRVLAFAFAVGAAGVAVWVALAVGA